MANELTISIGLLFEKSGAASLRLEEGGRSFDVAGTKGHHTTQAIATSEIAIDFAGLTPRWAFFKNLDSTNYVELRAGSGLTAFARLKAGEMALFPTGPAATFFAIANTAPVNLEVAAIEA